MTSSIVGKCMTACTPYRNTDNMYPSTLFPAWNKLIRNVFNLNSFSFNKHHKQDKIIDAQCEK